MCSESPSEFIQNFFVSLSICSPNFTNIHPYLPEIFC